ncbi:MAG: glutathione transferase GstA [Gammaproteobacteria bacterium]|nr:glutathione transferase GstA [Gammaproteobacteria bacterium]
MKLYFTPGACSLAPHIALREASLSFELHKVDLATKTVEGGANFLGVNPKGQVPALVLDDGKLLTEVPAIVQYIASLNPAAGLAPTNGSFARYRLQEWLNFITAELHKNLAQLFRSDLSQAAERYVRDTVATKFDYLEKHLARYDFLLDSGFSVADSYAFSIVNWTNFFSIELAPWLNLSQYMERVAARPSVREAMQAEGLGNA